MSLKPQINSITIGNFLSFGHTHSVIQLGALNVLVGPNGSGKSNLIEAIAFMRASRNDFQEITRRGGGVSEWIWKGGPNTEASVSMEWSLPVEYARRGTDFFPNSLRHIICFQQENQRFLLADEAIEGPPRATADAESPSVTYFDSSIETQAGETFAKLYPDMIKGYNRNLSILAQLKDPINHYKLAELEQTYSQIKIYRDFTFGRECKLRQPQSTDMPDSPLAEDFSNLGLHLNRLLETPSTKRLLIERLGDLLKGVSDIRVSIKGGTVQLLLQEGDFVIPATRLSDGTLRYLCLLAIFCDPDPPAVVCLEEPELGMHPDLIPKIGDMLLDLSTRSQVIVTTHSDILIDCLTEHPEAVLICEKNEGITTINRLSREKLGEWLKEYRLGQLWMKGQIGGTRW